ncbi:MAG: hypothetical protein KME30_02730 [Iphinoe sp. HA4291-MV1]|jgi:hypothetical protein|nr:hypothetical protein [Iphinoe sp. HA4291-MV1]
MHANNSGIRQAQWQISLYVSQSDAFTAQRYSIKRILFEETSIVVLWKKLHNCLVSHANLGSDVLKVIFN